MNAAHPLTYHLVKAEEAHRLARLERRARISADRPATHQDVVHHRPVHDKGRRLVPRAVAVAVTTIALVLGLVAGGALANSGGGGGGGGATRISLQ